MNTTSIICDHKREYVVTPNMTADARRQLYCPDCGRARFPVMTGATSEVNYIVIQPFKAIKSATER